MPLHPRGNAISSNGLLRKSVLNSTTNSTSSCSVPFIISEIDFLSASRTICGVLLREVSIPIIFILGLSNNTSFSPIHTFNIYRFFAVHMPFEQIPSRFMFIFCEYAFCCSASFAYCRLINGCKISLQNLFRNAVIFCGSVSVGSTCFTNTPRRRYTESVSLATT